MSDEYLTAFIRESEENITDLNNSLLALESDPENEEAMDAIFRTAHTLKGNFGAMGYTDASSLAHAIEDLLDEIRQGRMSVTADRMDLVFDGVDRIEGVLSEIEANGESTIDPTSTVERIRTTIAGADGDGGNDSSHDPAGGDAHAAGDDDDDGGDAVPGGLPNSLDALSIPVERNSDPVCYVDVTMADSEMKGVDAMLALDALDDALAVVGTQPERATLEDGAYDDAFDAFVLGTADEISETVESIGRIESATVTDVTDRLAPEESTRGENVDGTESESPDRSAGPTTVDEVKSVRVDVGQLDDLHSLVEQLVTSRIKLRRAVEAGEMKSAGDTLDEFDKISSNLQNTVMDMRLIPLTKVVGKFPRLIRDLARSQDKKIDFAMEGTDIELDRTILDEISDPLMHILRNAADHGIEPPAERERAGKPRKGTIRLRATRERDHVTITVTDDGGGLDAARIREKAIEKGVRTEAEIDAMDDSDVFDLIFHPGFSTTDEITDVSGRGVGMDVVHTTIARLDGSVSVDSEPGEGTTVTLRLPVSVAIVKVLFVQVGEAEYGVPIKNIDEVGRVKGIRTIGGTEVVSHDDEIYPIIRLREALAIGDRAGVAADATTRTDTTAGTDGAAASPATAATDGGSDAAGVDSDGDANDRHDIHDAHGTDDTHDTDSIHDTDDGTTDDAARERGMLIRIRESERQVALLCDGVNNQEEVVVKPFEGELGGTAGLSGTAVIGDGNVVPILDVVTL